MWRQSAGLPDRQWGHCDSAADGGLECPDSQTHGILGGQETYTQRPRSTQYTPQVLQNGKELLLQPMLSNRFKFLVFSLLSIERLKYSKSYCDLRNKIKLIIL